ncbi:MAG: DUF3108 domain-containing protein [Nitrospira sp.]|nr:DUF3108 domain-containing protein [Nitrospira sp.]MDR4481433.1 DUF3108 domain-containing protein [Nitrospira sp.]
MSTDGQFLAPVALPFANGEQLSYDVTWLGMRAGIATMVVQEHSDEQGRPQLIFAMTARSSPTVTKFYPVLNRGVSIVDLESFLPRHMTFARREGKRFNDFDYTFRHSEGLVTAVKDGKTDELQIPPDAQDAMSCLYYVRKVLPFVPGASLTMTVHHDKKNYKMDVRVEAIETLEGRWGKQQTARVVVIMPFQGIFLNEGNIRVWFTTDDHRVPVRMKAKVVVGSIVAELTEGYGSAGHQ